MSKTKIEIIEETAAFYNLNNRGMSNDGGCIYLNADTGNKCALGRCMTDEGLAKWGNYSEGAEYLAPTLIIRMQGDHGYTKSNSLDSILKEEYQGHDLDFWNDIQAFHDNSGYWNEEGLSSFGKRVKAELIQTYTNS